VGRWNAVIIRVGGGVGMEVFWEERKGKKTHIRTLILIWFSG
jgi:hypothetical protein